MFDDSEDLIETWCTVCDRQIKVAPAALPPPSSSTTAARKATPAGGHLPPGKYIAPKPPTFRRSKTGTIRVSSAVSVFVGGSRAEGACGPGVVKVALPVDRRGSIDKHTWSHCHGLLSLLVHGTWIRVYTLLARGGVTFLASGKGAGQEEGRARAQGRDSPPEPLVRLERAKPSHPFTSPACHIPTVFLPRTRHLYTTSGTGVMRC